MVFTILFKATASTGGGKADFLHRLVLLMAVTKITYQLMFLNCTNFFIKARRTKNEPRLLCLLSRYDGIVRI